MIQGFASQVMNFSNAQSKVNLRGNDVATNNDFNKILDSKTNNVNKPKDKVKDNSELLRRESARTNNRKVEVKNEGTNKKETDKPVEVELSKEEKTIEELIESLGDLLAVFQNIVGISMNDLENIDLEEVNLEISLEELEGLKLSLENLIKTMDLGESEEQITNTIANLGEMIEDVKIKGEIELPAEEFIVELKEVMDIVASQSQENMGKGTSEQIKNSTEQLEQLVSAIEGSKEDTSKTKENKSSIKTDLDGEGKEAQASKSISEEMLKTDMNLEKDDSLSIGFKVRVVTEKQEGINLFDSFKDMENFNVDLMKLDDIEKVPVDDTNSEIEKMAGNIFAAQENQASQVSTEASSKVVNNNIINPEQYMNIDKTDVLKQITSKVRADYQNELNEINIKLTPEHLGALTIKVSLERGILSARAMVENTNVKQLLQSNLGELKEALKEQGIEFNSIDVSVGEDQEFEEQSPNFFRNEKRIKGLKTNVDNPVDTNYYEDLDEGKESSSLEVGEGTMDITV